MTQKDAVLLLLLLAIEPVRGAARTRASAIADPVTVARHFLPPNADLATDYLFNFRTGEVSKRWPAVLTGHITGPNSKDIVFAYYSPVKVTVNQTLFLDLVQRSAGGYEKLFEISFRPEVLFGPHGFRLLHLRGMRRPAVAFIHGVGASLGARMDVYLWRNPWGWRNIFPPNSTGYTYFFPRKSGLDIALSVANHPGLNVSPPPIWYHWNGRSFVKIPPPPGSLKWPLDE